jgi:pimeloyl-ACP methyl ester carboxylesterase
VTSGAREPADFVVSRGGLRVAGLDWGGTGPALVLLHPNGFCAGLFDPLARRLATDRRVVGVDLRGHGGSDRPTERSAYRFAELAGDVVAVLDALGIERAALLGVSLGGGVGIIVDQLAPGRVAALVLCEAIAFPISGRDARGSANPMAELARRRRAIWPDRATMAASYAGRAPLNALAPEALTAYLRWGTRDRADGKVELCCPPEIEATIFEVSAEPGGAEAAWAHLGALPCPAAVLYGTRSDLPREWFEGQAQRAAAPLRAVDGGHFFLHEDTARAERLVRAVLAELGA